MCIMLTMESTIMDMAMGVDETDCRNVVFLFGFSLDGGRRIGMSGTNFCFVPINWVVLTGGYHLKIMTEQPVKSARFTQGLSLRNRKDLPTLRQNRFDGG